jgi:adenylyl-sulfate kinase
VGAGKTAIAFALEQRLFDLGVVCMVLDGENIRLGINRDLDFSPENRAEHLRRVAEIARLANDAGIVAICAFVSPTASVRDQVAEIVGAARFTEVHVDATFEWCAQRDTTGLYAKAQRGEVKNVAGVDAPFEPPATSALTLPMHEITVDSAVDRIVAVLRDKGVFTRAPQ